ncbi:hypothetical protein [Pontibacter sp. G13]|nr:hypothetical protein [Pontibacter sp. G13]WNJ17245.1 hypothetical protein RJD25_20510 [Pontibacter sp. G13]
MKRFWEKSGLSSAAFIVAALVVVIGKLVIMLPELWRTERNAA